MRLVIVESPAKCATIESYLGSGYKCIASFGHIRELQDLGCIDKLDKYSLTFKDSASKTKQIKKIGDLIDDCEEVIIATDDDREGEGIGWHICQVFSLNPETTKRIIFNEITKVAIQHAIHNPSRLDMNKVNAQLSRQTLDMLVGYQLSPVLWQHISRNKGLSAGRCQSPALRLLYDNQNEIDSTVRENIYTVSGIFTSRCIIFSLDTEFKSNNITETYLEDSVSHNHMYSVTPIRKSDRKPPEPFTTSSLQQRANSALKSSPKETMRVCQTLYEAGLITYMRTDNSSYSDDFIERANTYIKSNWGEQYVSNVNRKGSGAHEAIRVTNPLVMDASIIHSKLENRENKMYKLIWENTIESCMTPSQYNVFTAEVSGVKMAKYKYTTEKNIFPGWKIIKGGQLDDEYYEYLKALKENQCVEYKQITAQECVKNVKLHYTEAKLVDLLEKQGIGRPSTFSSIIEKIQERGYVVRGDVEGSIIKCKKMVLVENEITESSVDTKIGGEKNKLLIQDTGKLVIEFLMKNFGTIVDYGYTRIMEDNLDRIAVGNMRGEDLCKECDTLIIDSIEKVVADEKEERIKSGHIKIDTEHTYMIGKYGPIVRKVLNGVTTWVKVKEGLDIKKLQMNEYSLYDVIITGKDTIGNYNNQELLIYNGKYGTYTKYNDRNITLTSLGKDITLDGVISLIERPKMPSSTASVAREINKSLSIRTGKYGHYIYYKTSKMSKPKFLNFKGYKGEYMTDAKEDVLKWILDTHRIDHLS